MNFGILKMLHATLAVWQISTFVLNLDSQVTGFPLGKSQNGDDFLVLKSFDRTVFVQGIQNRF